MTQAKDAGPGAIEILIRDTETGEEQRITTVRPGESATVTVHGPGAQMPTGVRAEVHPDGPPE